MSEDDKKIEISEVMLQENRNLQLLQSALEKTLVKVFGEGEQSQKFINVSRIPMICQDLRQIRQDIGSIKTDVAVQKKSQEDLFINTSNTIGRMEQFLNNQEGKTAWKMDVKSGLIVGMIMTILGGVGWILTYYWPIVFH